MSAALKKQYLFEDAEWDFETLQRTYDAIENVALQDLGLDVYANQIEVIASEQMLDAYSAHGMPLMYQHWSFGKIFAREETMYRKGYSALAYEIVINSDPCISFLMEENTMTMQALVTAHAAFGHNHFFKNNYLFRQWTDAEAILDYLSFAKRYISDCEERHGYEAVEETLDAAHAIMDQGVFRYKRPPRLPEAHAKERMKKRDEYEKERFNDIWRTVPSAEGDGEDETVAEADARQLRQALLLPEENILYFLEKHSPVLRDWQRELLRIVRNIAQYFYPQKQTKVMNEGCATFVHHYIMQKLHADGLITDGSLLEFLHSHTSVVFQPEFDDPRYRGLNPYALGFAMMEDIRRICEAPTPEDLDWFPDFAGSNDWRGVLKYAWENFRDESFIQQYLSPKIIRDFKLFGLKDEEKAPYYEVNAIHDDQGYRQIRAGLARMYDIGRLEPNIQVINANLKGDRKLLLQHIMHDGVPLHEPTRAQVLKQVERLWGYEVDLESVDGEDA